MTKTPGRASKAQKYLRARKNEKRAKLASRFFKTHKGGYGEGDRFLGLPVPIVRTAARAFSPMPLSEIEKLISSPFHEERLLALFLLVKSYERSKADREKRTIYDFYIKHKCQINNWDLIDTSTPHIVGRYLLKRSRTSLLRLAKSRHLWDRRMAMMATFTFIRANDYGDAIRIATILVNDHHDLIHKAVGWMIREIGKRDKDVAARFLDKHAHSMPRTALRYALEKFSKQEKAHYMSLKELARTPRIPPAES